jgi:hypothetical protein
MNQKNKNRKIIALLLLSLAIMLIASGCGTSGASSLDLNSYDEDENQTANDSSSDSINSLTLSWSAPSINADGSPLEGDLAGYIMYYGQGTDNYNEFVDIGNFNSASVSNLTNGTWCFTITAYDVAGNESNYSAETCKTIS